MPVIDYRIHALERKFDLSKTEEKRQFVSEALKIVKGAESESVREELLKRIRDISGITYHALERDLQQVKKDAPAAVELPKERISEAAAGADKQLKAQRFILAAKLFSAPYAKDVSVRDLPLRNETHIIVANYIAEREERGERIRPSELFELLDEKCAEFNAILDLNYGEKLTGAVAERFFRDSVKTLQSEAIETEIARLNEEYLKTTEESERKEIAKKLSECVRRRNALKKS